MADGLITLTPGALLTSGQRLIDEAVAQIPEGKHLAALAVFSAAPGQTATVTLGVAVKAGEHVKVSAALVQELKKAGPTATVAVQWIW